MKNSTEYARKIKPLLAAGKGKAPAPPPPDMIRLMLTAILEENATTKLAEAALAALEEEFVDYNELRVSPVKDITDCLPTDLPLPRLKADAILRSLNAAFEHTNTLSLAYLAKRPKREVRKALREDLGLSPYAESVLTLYGFAGHAIPVDALLLEALKVEDYIHPGSDIEDLQGFLERIVPSKDALASHESLREYAAKQAKRVCREVEKAARETAEAAAIAAAAARAAKAAIPPPGTVPVALDIDEEGDGEAPAKPAEKDHKGKSAKPKKP